MPVGQEDVAPAARGFHQRANKWPSSKAVCLSPAPQGPWGAVLSFWGWWGRSCLVAVRMGSCPVALLAMGLAVAAGLGHAGRERGCGSLCVGWQQLCAGVEPTEQSGDVCRRQLGKAACKRRPWCCAGPVPVSCTPLHEPGSNLRSWGACSQDANASEKRKAQH